MIFNIFLLILSTAIWGYGFVAARWSLEGLGPYWANALRFVIAAFFSLPFLFYKKSFWRKDHILKKSFISSLFLLGILLFQTIGLSLTTVAKSGFITTLYTFFIPLIMMIVFKKKYRPTFWLLIAIALIGMGFLCNLEVKDLNQGDFLTLICSAFAAVHIIYVGSVASSIESPVEFNFLQNFFSAVLSVPIAFIFSGSVDLSLVFSPGLKVLHGLLFLGIISSMISFTMQIIAQKKIPAHITGFIFLMESPFAALFGYLVLGEVLTEFNLWGAVLIILSVLLVPVLGREVTAEKKLPHSHSNH